MEEEPFLPRGIPEHTAYDSAGFKNMSRIQQAFEKDVVELTVMGNRYYSPSCLLIIRFTGLQKVYSFEHFLE